MHRWHAVPLKWHYLALFEGGPISEHQAKTSVTTIQTTSRYTHKKNAQKVRLEDRNRTGAYAVRGAELAPRMVRNAHLRVGVKARRF
jgi:hypothetical protein